MTASLFPHVDRGQLRALCAAVLAAQTDAEEQRHVERIGHLFVPRRPGRVTMAMADQLEAAGSYGTAEIARKYAVDRPRWWHRFRRKGA